MVLHASGNACAHCTQRLQAFQFLRNTTDQVGVSFKTYRNSFSFFLYLVMRDRHTCTCSFNKEERLKDAIICQTVQDNTSSLIWIDQLQVLQLKPHSATPTPAKEATYLNAHAQSGLLI